MALLLEVWLLRDVRNMITDFLWEDRTTVYVASLSANCWGALEAEARQIVLDYRWFEDVLLEEDIEELVSQAIEEDVRAMIEAGDIL